MEELSKSTEKYLKKCRVFVRKSIWVIVILASICGLGYYLRESYIKWNLIPEITMNEKFIPNREIPFPAVTICSPLVVKSDFLKLSKYYYDKRNYQTLIPNLMIEERKIISAYSHACFDYNLFSMLRTEFVEEAINEDTVKMLNRSAPTIENSLFGCSFGNIESCENLFLRTLTDDGYCFTFNMLGYHSLFNENISKDFDSYKRKKIFTTYNTHFDLNKILHDDDKDPKPSNWTLEDGYLVDERFIQPARAVRSDSLDVVAIMDKNDLSNLCVERENSYKVILHLPNEIPTIFHIENFFELKTSKTISVSATVSKFDDSLRKFSPKDRGCYFEGERKLKLFKFYTKINCEYECMINFTMEMMNCTKFSMPRTNDMKVCDINVYESYRLIMDHWPESYYLYFKFHKLPLEEFPCNCLEPCSHIKYSIINERSYELHEGQSSLAVSYMKAMSIGRINYTISTIKIIFPISQISKTTSFVAYKIQNFISDVGGLIGLFLGFSILSLFELASQIYYSSIKLINRLKCRRNSDKINFRSKIQKGLRIYRSSQTKNRNQIANKPNPVMAEKVTKPVSRKVKDSKHAFTIPHAQKIDPD